MTLGTFRERQRELFLASRWNASQTASVSALQDCCLPADPRKSELCVTGRCSTSRRGCRPQHFVGRLVSGEAFRVSLPWIRAWRRSTGASHLCLWACMSCIEGENISFARREWYTGGEVKGIVHSTLGLGWFRLDARKFFSSATSHPAPKHPLQPPRQGLHSWMFNASAS